MFEFKDLGGELFVNKMVFFLHLDTLTLLLILRPRAYHQEGEDEIMAPSTALFSGNSTLRSYELKPWLWFLPQRVVHDIFCTF